MSMFLNRLSKIVFTLMLPVAVMNGGCGNSKDKDDDKPSLNLTPAPSGEGCPELLFDFATVGVPEYDLLYTYVAVAGSTVGSDDNINTFEGHTLRVQPRNCRSLPSGSMLINTVQVAKVDKESGLITAEVIFLADPETGYYKAKTVQTRIPVYPINFRNQGN